MSGIYIHIPFCKQACYYCDFHFSTSLSKREEMVLALKKELILRKDEFSDQNVETIYFGGGTPSLLTVEEINSIIKTVFKYYKVVNTPEITLEANPDDLFGNQIEQLALSRINRLSIGVQSFFEDDLKLMNRAHTSFDAEYSIRRAKKYFDNISIDLIYGIPKMSTDRWKQNIQKALSFDISHISSYALTVEPRTVLAHFIKKGIVPSVDDEVALSHFNVLTNTLEESGFIGYEISNFAKPGFFSKNNTAYWLQKKYIGIGPSAHSFNGRSRSWNVRNNSKYIASIEKEILPQTSELLTTTDAYNEFVMTGLRTIWGVSMVKVKALFGEEYYHYLLKQSKKFLTQNLLILKEETLVTTKKGRFLTDGIASDLFMIKLEET